MKIRYVFRIVENEVLKKINWENHKQLKLKVDPRW